MGLMVSQLRSSEETLGGEGAPDCLDMCMVVPEEGEPGRDHKLQWHIHSVKMHVMQTGRTLRVVLSGKPMTDDWLAQLTQPPRGNRWRVTF